MDDNKMNNMPKDTMVMTPIDVILAMAKDEIGTMVINCMNNNHLTPGLMVCVLKDVLLDMTQMQLSYLSSEFTKQQETIMGTSESGKQEG